MTGLKGLGLMDRGCGSVCVGFSVGITALLAQQFASKAVMHEEQKRRESRQIFKALLLSE